MLGDMAGERDSARLEPDEVVSATYYPNKARLITAAVSGSLAGLLAGIGFSWWFKGYAKKVQDATGKIYPVLIISLAAILLFVALTFFQGRLQYGMLLLVGVTIIMFVP